MRRPPSSARKMYVAWATIASLTSRRSRRAPPRRRASTSTVWMISYSTASSSARPRSTGSLWSVCGTATIRRPGTRARAAATGSRCEMVMVPPLSGVVYVHSAHPNTGNGGATVSCPERCAIPPFESAHSVLARLVSVPRAQGRRKEEEQPVATDLERFVSADGRDEQIAAVRRKIDGLRRHVRLLPVPLSHRADHGQGRARGALGVDGAQGLPARLRRDRQPLRRPPRRVHRVRPRVGRARRPARAGDVPGAPVGLEGRARVVHLLPRARGPRGRRRVPHLRLPRQPPADPGASSSPTWACTSAPAPSPR